MIAFVVGFALWLLAIVVILALCRAAAMGDRRIEAQSARWLADKQRERDDGRPA